jgi:AAA domain
MTRNDARPITHQRDLAKLPPALLPLIERPQWCVWSWIQKSDGSWQKPPFMATQPDRHASTSDPTTWTDYATALAAVQAGHADGISYILTRDDPFGAIDLDHCRDKLCSIDVWAQNFMDVARNTYQEVTPSGEGVRIWGLAGGDPLNRKFTLDINNKPIAAELFRRTNKALTVTGYRLNTVQQLVNIDKVFDWAVVWGERRKAAAEQATLSTGNGFASSGCKYTIDQIEQIVREGPPAGTNRSDVFHAIVGHYVGCGWQVDRILEHLKQSPDGVGSRYLAEDRLRQEIERSAGKYAKTELPLFDSWEAKAPQPEAPAQEKEAPPIDDEPEPDAEDEDDELDDDDLGDEDAPEQHPNLPRLHTHGSADPRPLKAWLIKHLISQVGHGLMSGQWGAGKTFAFFDLAASLNTGQSWLGHVVKRQCGVLLIAAEGADEVRLRLDAVVREKCGGMSRAPFVWYETAPLLLQKGAVEKLIAMARQAEASLQDKFGLPLGPIGIDTIAACAGYSRAGDENDNAVGQALMNVLKAVAQELGCFVLGIDHFGKNLEAGTRGAGSKESAGDVILACLGDKQLSGSVTNTRLAVRKHRGGRQGQEYPFTLRMVEAPEKDEDGDPITTMVVDWLPPGAGNEAPTAPDDPWAKPKRQDQRTAALRLKRVLMTILAEQGVDLPITPDGPMVRMVDQKLVRKAFYACTPADEGTPERKGHFKRQKFLRALDWAEDEQLIAITEIEGVTYLRLTRPSCEEGDD